MGPESKLYGFEPLTYAATASKTDGFDDRLDKENNPSWLPRQDLSSTAHFTPSIQQDVYTHNDIVNANNVIDGSSSIDLLSGSIYKNVNRSYSSDAPVKDIFQFRSFRTQIADSQLDDALKQENGIKISKSSQRPRHADKDTLPTGDTLHQEHDGACTTNHPCQPNIQQLSSPISNARHQPGISKLTSCDQRHIVADKPISRIGHLSTEVLTGIFTQVRNFGDASYLASCSLVCKHWQATMLPVLYRDVVLNNSNILPFCKIKTTSYYAYVRSLSIAIRPISPIDSSAREPSWPLLAYLSGRKHELESAEAKKLWFYMSCYIPATIHKMPNLATFSITLMNRHYVPFFFIPKETITMLIDSLPETCVNLELDTMGEEEWGHSTRFHPHICNSISQILPRLRNLRLRLGKLCPAAFGFKSKTVPLQWVDDMPDLSKDAESKGAPNLETCSINLVQSELNCSRLCGDKTQFPNWPRLAQIDVTSCLSRLIEEKLCPKIKILTVLDLKLGTDDPSSLHDGSPSSNSTFFRRNVISNTTWAIPFNQIQGRHKNLWLVRTPEAEDVISYMWAIQAHIEGGTWKTTTSGSRCPFSLLRGDCESSDISGHEEDKIPLITAESHRKRTPAHSTKLWKNEDKTGQRLRDAVLREGTLIVEPVKEETPYGWIRNGTIIYPEE